jgi:catechol 2,3-dioxygenase-like lactoylglutathione lyase family enzyme
MSQELRSLGIRHLALNVKDPQLSKEFYVRVLKMKIEWEPDADNVYLTRDGHDNLALHRATGNLTGGHLDHLGIAVPSIADVDQWHEWVSSQKIKILKAPKTHRDGARSFYFADPDGVVIQVIFHPPIAARAAT